MNGKPIEIDVEVGFFVEGENGPEPFVDTTDYSRQDAYLKLIRVEDLEKDTVAWMLADLAIALQDTKAQLTRSQGRIAELSAVVALVLDEVRTARNPLPPLEVKVSALERAYEVLKEAQEQQPTTLTKEGGE